MPSGLPRFFVLLLLAVCSLSALRADGSRVAVVDMEALFQKCNAAKEALARHDAEEKQAVAEYDERTAALRKLVSVIESLKSAGESGSSSKTLQEKISQARRMDRENSDYRDARAKELQERMIQARKAVLAKISKAVAVVAKSKDVAVVLDTSASAPGALPLVTYAREDLDLTKEVLEVLNAGSVPALAP